MCIGFLYMSMKIYVMYVYVKCVRIIMYALIYTLIDKYIYIFVCVFMCTNTQAYLSICVFLLSQCVL